VIFQLVAFAALLYAPARADVAASTAIHARTVALSEPSLFGNTLAGRTKTAKLLIVMVAFEAAGHHNIIGDGGTSFGPMQIKPDTWLNAYDTGPLKGFEYPDLFDMEWSMRAGLRILHSLRAKASDPSIRTVRHYLYAYASGRYDGTPDARKTIDARCKWIGGCE
jgi:hypothetical protein